MPGTGWAERHGALSKQVSESVREGGNVVVMQRRRLLLAIGEVLSEDGLESASVGRVCKRAGMSRRTFYEIFEDREDCLLAALDGAIECLGANVGLVYGRAGRWRERVRAALALLLECFDVEPGLARLCLVETLKASPRVLERRRWVLEELSVVIDEGRSEAKSDTGPAPLTAESIVGGVLSVLHARVIACPPAGLPPATNSPRTGECDVRPLVELLNPLMSMIVHPYLGPVAARRELETPVVPGDVSVAGRVAVNGAGADPFRDLPIRFTYRTARVMSAIASEPGINNREVGELAGVHDQGQMSKLLRRLQRNGLIENHRSEQARGEPNAWTLTDRGHAVHTAIDTHTGA
jgi:AcrR family transcriptional regulator